MQITKDRADAINAAWEAANDTQRLILPRCEWVHTDTTSYFELSPSKLELAAAKRIAELEGALRSVANVKAAIELCTSDAERADECESKLNVARYIARKALGV